MAKVTQVTLTPGRIADLRCESGQAFLWDAKVPGLGVRVTSSGKKAFIVQGRLGRDTIRLTIKDTGAITLDTARAEAQRILLQIGQGIDPREAKRQRIETQKAEREARKVEEARQEAAKVLVGEAWKNYLEDRTPFWGKRHHLDHIRLAQTGMEKAKRGGGTLKPGPLAPLMHLQLSDLSSERIESWLEKECAARPTQTRLAFGSLKTFLGWCAEHPVYQQVVPTAPLLTRKVRSLLPHKKAKSDYLQREQLPGWFAAVRQIGNLTISTYLQCLLLIGARREELATLEWSGVDFTWKSITIHDKVEGLRVIPLTPYVESLLSRLPRKNKWVFASSKSASGRITEPRIAHNKALVIAGIDDLTLHGLRRSYASLAEWVELPLGVVAQIMGHKPSATAERHYKRRPLDLLRQWAERYKAWLLEMAGIEAPERREPGEVLRLVAAGGWR